MALSTAQNNVGRASKQIADLRKSDATLAKKEGDLLDKINRASESVTRKTSASMANMKPKEVVRATKDLANVQKKRADLSNYFTHHDKFYSRYRNILPASHRSSPLRTSIYYFLADYGGYRDLYRHVFRRIKQYVSQSRRHL